MISADQKGWREGFSFFLPFLAFNEMFPYGLAGYAGDELPECEFQCELLSVLFDLFVESLVYGVLLSIGVSSWLYGEKSFHRLNSLYVRSTQI